MRLINSQCVIEVETVKQRLFQLFLCGVVSGFMIKVIKRLS